MCVEFSYLFNKEKVIMLVYEMVDLLGKLIIFIARA